MNLDSSQLRKLWTSKLTNFLLEHQLQPQKLDLYLVAFTHSSYSKQHNSFIDYEKLEFFGDAIIGFVVAEFVYLKSNQTTLSLGDLSRRKHFLVSDSTLARVSRNLKLATLVLNAIPEVKLETNDAILSDVFEAFIGALYLDLGIAVTKKFLLQHLLERFYSCSLSRVDYPSLLQELTQKQDKTVPNYVFEQHGKEFLVKCQYRDITIEFKDRSKKAARNEVSRLMLEKLGQTLD